MVGDARSGTPDSALRSRLLHAAAQAVYCAVLLLSYQAVESVVFEYQGLRWNPPTALYTGTAISALVALAALGPINVRQPSSLMYWMTLVTVTTPIALFAPHAASLQHVAVAPLILSMMVSQAALLAAARTTDAAPYQLPGSALERFSAVLIIAILIGTLVLVTRPGFAWSFDIIDVYTRRLAARDASPEGALTSYVIATLNAALAPVGVAVGLWHRRWLLLGVSIFALLGMFAFSGIKSALLTPVFLALFLRAGASRMSGSPVVLFAGAIVLIAIAYQRWVGADDATLSEAFTRRLIVSKGVSTEQYFEAFRDSPQWFGDSGILRLFGTVPARAKTFIIGELFGFGAEENANANAWAAMFANVGYAGFAIVTASLMALMRVFDRLAATGGRSVVRAYSGYAVFILGETALETSILNGGLIIGTALVVWYSAAQQRVTSADA